MLTTHKLAIHAQAQIIHPQVLYYAHTGANGSVVIATMADVELLPLEGSKSAVWKHFGFPQSGPE